MTAYEFTYMVTCGQVDQTRVPESRPPHDCFPHRHRIAVIAAVVEWVEWVRMENPFQSGLSRGGSERVLPHRHRIVAIAAVVEWVEWVRMENPFRSGL